ncbi:protein-tyrosine phosphatase-like protein [Mortierella sp. GBAus27b]|nr:Protein tyrosine phosphatase type IVA 1 [Mortierella sp. GBA43]KAI8362501.1 protein-tyrosine phosphatase-like protein [Mortierella sp. GBAus27b]
MPPVPQARPSTSGLRPLNPPAVVEYKNMRFLISDAPSDSNLSLYVAEFERHLVKDVIRVCDPTYGTGPLEKMGIQVHDWPFSDGEGPPPNIVKEWLALVEQRFGKYLGGKPESAIAVHCVAGLGRAPLLVAIALIEAGMTQEESVNFIRTHKRGALNTRQAHFVMDYKPKRERKAKCTIL